MNVFINDISELVVNATNAHRVSHRDVKKKGCKVALCIQSVVDAVNFDWIAHVESTNGAWDIFVKYYEGAIQESNNLETLKLEDLVCSKGKGFKIQYRHCRLRHGISMKDKRATKGKEEGANLACHDADDYEDMVVMDAIADEHVDTKIGFLDTGCFNHMLDRKVWLTYFDESKKSKVQLEDNSSFETEGIDNITIQRRNGAKARIKDVLYVPGIKCNLISVGQLFEKGFLVLMKDGALELYSTLRLIWY
ncbi:uncharacterized protein LOC131605507 [Vicia villosa]|uniref:uncharacterized protein LOC131605507 n=1 Tax=Vicia villosa TaxID=3911 RepID=UPI00273B984E|nr:uncharacterized protein LOC131605507 [Vicia villosa]